MFGLPNVLPFSGERRTDARSYHGREEPRAPARGVAARPALERAAQAFSRCNGLLGGVPARRFTAARPAPVAEHVNNLRFVELGIRRVVETGVAKTGTHQSLGD